MESYPEMLRLRVRVEGVDATIAAKEADLVRLRTATDPAPSAPDSEAAHDSTPKP